MPELIGAAALLTLAAAVGCVWFFLRHKTPSIKRLNNNIEQIKRGGGKTGRINRLLQQIYNVIEQSIAAKNLVDAYEALDLLKIAFGEGFIREGEPAFLTAIIIKAVQNKQFDIASAALDAYRQMLRRQSSINVPSAIEELGVIAAVVLREKQNFLAAKAADIVYEALERPDSIVNPGQFLNCLPTLKIIGLLALRRKDGGMFRELVTRLSVLTTSNPQYSSHSDQILAFSGEWLHRIVKNNDSAMFEILRNFIVELLQVNSFPDFLIYEFIEEWQDIAGTACLNPNSELAQLILGFTLAVASETEKLKILENAVRGAGQDARLAISRRGLEIGFPVLMPLLDFGRELLSDELNYGYAGSEGSFRSKALFAIVRECVAIAEYIARQNMISTAADSITDFNRFWVQSSAYASPKIGKRFCQLLLVYWLKFSKQAKKAVISEELTKPQVLTESDQQKLDFLH